MNSRSSNGYTVMVRIRVLVVFLAAMRREIVQIQFYSKKAAERPNKVKLAASGTGREELFQIRRVASSSLACWRRAPSLHNRQDEPGATVGYCQRPKADEMDRTSRTSWRRCAVEPGGVEDPLYAPTCCPRTPTTKLMRMPCRHRDRLDSLHATSSAIYQGRTRLREHLRRHRSLSLSGRTRLHLPPPLRHYG